MTHNDNAWQMARNSQDFADKSATKLAQIVELIDNHLVQIE